VIRGLFGRLLLVMCGVAAASTGLVLLLQDRTLAGDLERAAQGRLDAAALAAERLLESHLGAMAERYRAVSGTPQFRATLEVDDGPTLAHYADALLGQHDAARIAFASPEDRIVAAAGEPGLDAKALAVEGGGVVAHAGRAYAVVSTPLAGAGRLVAVEAIDAARLAEWSEFCGARVSFARPEEAGEERIQRTVRRLEGLELRVTASLRPEREALAHARLNLAMAAGLGLLVALGVSLVVSRNVVRPIHEVQAAARRIGSGDLTTSVASQRSDEIGDVARAFEEMRQALRATLGGVAGAADRVDATAAAIAAGTQRFFAVTKEQQHGNEEVAAMLEEIQQRVQSIAKSAGESAQSLDLAVDGSTESFRELARSGDDMKENASGLWMQTQEITQSLERVASNAAAVATDTETLLPAVEVTAQSVALMASAARSVNAHADETARLSGTVVEAAESGRRVVREAVQGMEAMRETTDESERVIRSLRERGEEIGTILTVIDDVTDETGLLALNAAIIASQAGEHGKAFAVVAEEMRALATRVQASTKEIDQVVRAVQGESVDAAESIARGSVLAREAAALIQEAESGLDEITRAARESGGRMTESARSTAEQMQGASAVAVQMEAVSEGVDRIRSATREQAVANDVVQRSSDALHTAARAVQGTVDVQTRGTSQIGESIEAVQRAVREITLGLEEQGAASHQVAEVMGRSEAYTRSYEASAAEMGDAARELEREAEALREAVRRFRI
jgi:methyl-accepting chemotaxis protein